VAADRLRAEHEALSAAVGAATKAAEVGKVELAAAGEAKEAVRKEERASARNLDEYAQKRDATRQMIDTGTAQDYDAAQRQLENCLRLVDELETKGLELLDRLDAAEAAQQRASRTLAEAEAVLVEARARLAARDTPIRAELAQALQDREAAWGAVRPEHRGPYNDLRRRKRRALVNTLDGNCAQCAMRIPPQRIVEVQLDRAVHTCPGCQGFVLP
jgi:predicted  nucleic acid-binding Zn-ribbon protein